ncbi:hypothetical protein ETR_01776 [Erwinia tracheiphila PSU-1]|nr:hypothetical protein ETR_01776 [Erwinia tracheiphila PSU-1]
MLDAVRRYAALCVAERLVGTKFVQMAQTFLGSGHEFDTPWTPGQDSVKINRGSQADGPLYC